MSYNFPLQLPTNLLDGGPGKIRKHPAHWSNLGYPQPGQSWASRWRLNGNLHEYVGRLCVSRAAVLHTVEEPNDDYESGPVWFASAAATNSMHAYGDGDGDLYQLVDFNHPAWGHGTGANNWQPPRPTWWDGFSYNTASHGLELEGYTAEITERWRDDPENPQRRTASIWLAFEAHLNGWPLDRRHVVGHEELSKSKRDPGIAAHGFPIDELIAEARERLGGVGTGTAPQPGAITDEQFAAAKHEAWVRGWRSGWQVAYRTAVADAIRDLGGVDTPPAPSPNPPLDL